MRTCSECRLEKPEELFGRRGQKCKSCIYIKVKAWHMANKDRVRGHQNKNTRTVMTRFRTAKRQSLDRDRRWDLTIDQYRLLIIPPCYYCKGFFKKVETGSGLDRIDNKIGYTKENVVSCCTTCNKIKNDFLSFEETIQVIDFIVKLRS